MKEEKLVVFWINYFLLFFLSFPIKAYEHDSYETLVYNEVINGRNELKICGINSRIIISGNEVIIEKDEHVLNSIIGVKHSSGFFRFKYSHIIIFPFKNEDLEVYCIKNRYFNTKLLIYRITF